MIDTNIVDKLVMNRVTAMSSFKEQRFRRREISSACKNDVIIRPAWSLVLNEMEAMASFRRNRFHIVKLNGAHTHPLKVDQLPTIYFLAQNDF